MNKMILKNLFSDNNIIRIIEGVIRALDILIRIEDNEGVFIYGEQDAGLLKESCDIRVANTIVGVIKGNKNVYDISSLISNLAQNEMMKEGLLKNIGDRNKIINILYRMAEIMTTGDIEEPEYLILEEIMSYFESNIVFVALSDKKTNDLKVEIQFLKKFGKVLSKNLSKDFIDINNPVIKGVMENKQGIIAPDTRQDGNLSKMSALIASFICVPIIYKNNAKGVILVGNDSILSYKLSDLKVFNSIAFQVGIYIENLRLYNNVRDTLFDSVKVISKISELRKNSLGRTNKRIIKFSVDIAKRMKFSEIEQGQVRLAAMICNIGKVSISDEVFYKGNAVSREELKKLKEIPVIASEIIKEISTLSHLEPIIRAQYEKFDGSGYPDRLKENQIPVISRILAVASEFDGQISQKDFNIDTDLDNILEELKNSKGTKFDPEIVDEFLRVLRDKSKEEILEYLNKE